MEKKSRKQAKKVKHWTPKVLMQYEVGRCFSAIEAVALLGKPIAEVMTRHAEPADLEADLKKCLGLGRHNGYNVKFWVRKSGAHMRYGFYQEEWALQALDFLDSTELDPVNHAWISGLLFGYRPDAIQHFINAKVKKKKSSL